MSQSKTMKCSPTARQAISRTGPELHRDVFQATIDAVMAHTARTVRPHTSGMLLANFPDPAAGDLWAAA